MSKSTKTIEEKIFSAFNSSLGQQCNSLFSTTDKRIFIRLQEAMDHAEGKLDPNTKPLEDKTILEWFDDMTNVVTNPYSKNL